MGGSYVLQVIFSREKHTTGALPPENNPVGQHREIARDEGARAVGPPNQYNKKT